MSAAAPLRERLRFGSLRSPSLRRSRRGAGLSEGRAIYRKTFTPALRLHLHHHPRRVDHKDLPPRATADHRLAFILPRTQRQQCVPRLARGVFPFLHAQHRARHLLLGRGASARRIHRLRPAAELEDLESRRAGLPRGLARGARLSVLSAQCSVLSAQFSVLSVQFSVLSSQFSERIGHAI